ncbi:MAG: DUF4169 family protein [Xanthobacteraceae bacterium]|jgi:hypothetical protein
MGPIVNLRSARKQAKRRQAEQDAAQNRLVHGQPKSAKALARAQREQAQKAIEQHRIERKDAP